MSDRTYLTFLAHHVPDNKISVFAEIFGPCLVNENPDDWDPVEIRPLSDAGAPNSEPVEHSFASALRRGVTEFHVEEAPCGTVESADFSALAEAVPDAVWEFWEDPKYEWLGSWIGYHPGCGLVGPLECDSHGDQQVSYQEAEARINASTQARPDALQLPPDRLLAVVFPQRAFRLLVRQTLAGGD